MQTWRNWILLAEAFLWALNLLLWGLSRAFLKGWRPEAGALGRS